MENYISSCVLLNQISYLSFRPLHSTAYQIFPLALLANVPRITFRLVPKPYKPVVLSSADGSSVHTAGQIRILGSTQGLPTQSPPPTHSQVQDPTCSSLYSIINKRISGKLLTKITIPCVPDFIVLMKQPFLMYIVSQPSGSVLPSHPSNKLCPRSVSCPRVIYTQSHKNKKTASLFLPFASFDSNSEDTYL